MAVIESAWESHPGYRIDLVPYRGVARAWHGDLLLAESTGALRVIETDHVERLYFPEGVVRLDLFAANDHHTICPFKGEADYWTLTAVTPGVEDVFWTYRDLFDEVAGLKGYLGVYHEKVRVELETRWPDDARAVRTNPFPVWGDQSDLLRLIDAQESGPNQAGPRRRVCVLASALYWHIRWLRCAEPRSSGQVLHPDAKCSDCAACSRRR